VLKFNPRFVQIVALSAIGSILFVATARPETPPNAIANESILISQSPFGDDNRPPFARDDDRPPFARDDNRPPFARDDDRPPFARDDDRPPFARDDDRPPFVRDDDRPPFKRDDDRPPLARNNGSGRTRNDAIRLPNGEIVRLDD
jgi:hypothetical protein